MLWLIPYCLLLFFYISLFFKQRFGTKASCCSGLASRAYLQLINQFKSETCSSRLIAQCRVLQSERCTHIKHMSIKTYQPLCFSRFLKCYNELSDNSSTCAFLWVICNTNDKCQNNGEHRSHIPKLPLLPLETNFTAVGSHFMTGILADTAQPQAHSHSYTRC